MDKDKKAIEHIISDMLFSAHEHGSFPTGTACAELEKYVESARMEAMGWMHAAACVSLDRGEDIRQAEVPELVRQALSDLSAE